MAYFGFIRLFIGPYPGRKTTAGNAAAPFMPVVIPVSDVYTFSIYHLLPLADPVAPFPCHGRSGCSRDEAVRRGGDRPQQERRPVHADGRHLLRRPGAVRRRPRSSALLTAAGVAAAYGVPVDTVKGVYWDARILGAKVSLLRWSSSSDPFCADLFGAHLHTPLSSAELV